MSRRRRSRRPRVTPVQRHYGRRVRPRMSRSVTLAPAYSPRLTLAPLSLLPTLDRRTWFPDRNRPLTIAINPPGGDRNADRLIDRSWARSILGFASPRKVSVCLRRETRKRVIHARGIAGGKVRRANRNALSNVSSSGGR